MSDTPKPLMVETMTRDELQDEVTALRERLAEAERLNSEARPLIEEAHRECVANRELAEQAEQRAERAEALAEQNAKDAERLDWLEARPNAVTVNWFVIGTLAPTTGEKQTIRQLIDAARSAT